VKALPENLHNLVEVGSIELCPRTEQKRESFQKGKLHEKIATNARTNLSR
jgi:hypothetical protein